MRLSLLDCLRACRLRHWLARVRRRLHQDRRYQQLFIVTANCRSVPQRMAACRRTDQCVRRRGQTRPRSDIARRRAKRGCGAAGVSIYREVKIRCAGRHFAVQYRSGRFAYRCAKQKGFIAAQSLSDALTLDKGTRYTFRLRPSTYMQAAMLADEIAKLPAKRWQCWRRITNTDKAPWPISSYC